MPDYTTKLALKKPFGDNNETVNVEEDLGANFDKIDDALGTLWITDATTPANADLYHGRTVRYLTSGKEFTAKSDGSGGFTLIEERGARYYGGLGAGLPTNDLPTLLIPFNIVRTLTAVPEAVMYPAPFPNGVLSVNITNGDSVTRPGMHAEIYSMNSGGFEFRCYIAGTLLNSGGVRVTGVAIGY